jgi:hypothetical protein
MLYKKNNSGYSNPRNTGSIDANVFALITQYLPTQTGNSGKVLGTNGFALSWITPSTGISSLNALIGSTQVFSLGTLGTDFNIVSALTTHTFNLPVASATNTGKLSSADWLTFDGKQNALGFTPENVANKQSALSTSADHYYNAPYINTLPSTVLQRIFIASDQTTTSNAAANITGLVTATLDANKTYIVRGVISVTSAVGATGGIKIGATLPTGATSIIFLSGRGSSTTMTQEASIDGALQPTASNRISAAASDLIVSGNITTSSTAGTVQFRFASGTNGQSNSVIAARTYIEIFEKL